MNGLNAAELSKVVLRRIAAQLDRCRSTTPAAREPTFPVYGGGTHLVAAKAKVRVDYGLPAGQSRPWLHLHQITNAKQGDSQKREHVRRLRRVQFFRSPTKGLYAYPQSVDLELRP